MSGGVLAAGAPGETPGINVTPGAVYVFTRPAGGWSDATEAAKLVASDSRAGDRFGSTVAISGKTVVVGSGSGGLPYGNGLYVFTKPPAGWSGTLHERARLIVSGPVAGALGPVAISANTIAVGAPDPGLDGPSGPGAVYVFNKPTRGWSGTIYPSAKLTTAHGAGYTELGITLAVSGRTIFATAYASPYSGSVFVFNEPKRGWKGSLHQQATLTDRSMIFAPMAAFGANAVGATTNRGSGSPISELVVFHRPARGWSGRRQPAARLRLTLPPVSSYDSVGVSDLADSDTTIAALVIGPSSSSCAPYPGICGETLYTFNRPARGWKATVPSDAHATITPPAGYAVAGGAYLLAIDGQTIATATNDAIDIFTHAAR